MEALLAELRAWLAATNPTLAVVLVGVVVVRELRRIQAQVIAEWRGLREDVRAISADVARLRPGG